MVLHRSAESGEHPVSLCAIPEFLSLCPGGRGDRSPHLECLQ